MADLDDSLRTKQALERTGHFKTPSYGITPYPDEPLFEAIEAFQSQNGLRRDGVMKPDGETARKLGELTRGGTQAASAGDAQVAAAPALLFLPWLAAAFGVASLSLAASRFSSRSSSQRGQLYEEYKRDTGNNNDFCYERWENEKAACGYREKKWQGGCRERATERWLKCVRNGGVPDPEEPPEWSDADEETSFNPDR